MSAKGGGFILTAKMLASLNVNSRMKGENVGSMKWTNYSIERSSYGMCVFVVFASESERMSKANDWVFWYLNNSYVNTVRAHFSWSNLDIYISHLYEEGAVLWRPPGYVTWHSSKSQDKVKLWRKHTPWKGGVGWERIVNVVILVSRCRCQSLGPWLCIHLLPRPPAGLDDEHLGFFL